MLDARQTRTLLDEAAALGAAHGLRCVDVEGGTVDRLRDALAPMPSAQAVARASSPMSQKRDVGHPAQADSNPTHSQKARMDGAPGHPNFKGRRTGLATEHGVLVAQAVKAFGFNTTLAPVLDLGLPESAAVMGARAAAATAKGVTEYARAFLSGLAAQGVAGCGKHFPGLGGGTLRFASGNACDSTRQRRDLAGGSGALSRAARRAADGDGQSCGVSGDAGEKTAGERIGILDYDGAARADRLPGARVLGRSGDGRDSEVSCRWKRPWCAAVRAGMDLLEICHSPELILRAYEALIAEGERSAAFRTTLLARAKRAERQRAKTVFWRHFEGAYGEAI